MKTTLKALVLGVFVTLPLVARAGTISKPHTFSSGNTASASQVNTNFDTLYTEVNAKEARISALETSAATTVPISKGGTGATTASTALSNLGGAPLASPSFTGSPTAPTQTARDNSTKLATTAYADSAVAADLMPVAIGYYSKVNASNPTTQYDESARAVVLLNSSNVGKVFRSVSLTVDATTNGANGLDTGSLQSKQIYYRYLIGKADGTVAGFLSLSTSPTLPSGYTFSRPMGWVTTDGSSQINKYVQDGNHMMFNLMFIDAQWTSLSTGTTYTRNLFTGASTAYNGPMIPPSLCRKVDILVHMRNGSGQDVDFTSPGFTSDYTYTNAGNLDRTIRGIPISSAGVLSFVTNNNTTNYSAQLMGAWVNWY